MLRRSGLIAATGSLLVGLVLGWPHPGAQGGEKENLRDALARKFNSRAGQGGDADRAFRLPRKQPFEFQAAVLTVKFSPDGRFLLVGCRNSTETVNRLIGRSRIEKGSHAPLFLWDLTTGAVRQRFLGHSAHEISHAAFSPDGKLMASSALDGFSRPTLIVWNVATGESLKEFDFGGKLEFSADGKFLSCVTNRGVVGAIDVETLELVHAWDIKYAFYPLFALPQPHTFLGFARNGEFRQLDVLTGRDTTRVQRAENVNNTETFTVAPSAGLIASSHVELGSEEKVILLRELATGRELRRLRLNKGVQLSGIQFLENGARVATLTDKGDYRVWNRSDGAVASQTPLGGQFDACAFHPEGKVVALADDYDLCVNLVDLASGAHLVRLHQFDDPRDWRCETVDGFSRTSPNIVPTLDDPLTEDEPRVAAVLASLMEPRGTSTLPSKPKRNGKLFLLGIGVGQSQVPKLALKYPAKDVRALRDCFRELGEQGGAQVLEQCYLDEEATAKSIREGLAWLQRSCGPEDEAIVFFAGHALKGKKGLYYVPYDGDPLNVGFSTCVNWADIAESITETKAGKILFLADCCHAGAFGNAFFPATQKELAEELRGKKGLSILSASRGEELSQESKEWEHGAFTFALLEAIRDKRADTHPKDGSVSFAETCAYVLSRVPEITGDLQHPELFGAEKVDSSPSTPVGPSPLTVEKASPPAAPKGTNIPTAPATSLKGDQ